MKQDESSVESKSVEARRKDVWLVGRRCKSGSGERGGGGNDANEQEGEVSQSMQANNSRNDPETEAIVVRWPEQHASGTFVSLYVRFAGFDLAHRITCKCNHCGKYLRFSHRKHVNQHIIGFVFFSLIILKQIIVSHTYIHVILMRVLLRISL